MIKKLALVFTLLLTTNVYGYDLLSKPRNTDKHVFETISGSDTNVQGEFSLGAETSYTVYPLVAHDTQNGQINSLINGLMAFELSMVYGLTDNFQIGLLIPLESPIGVAGGDGEGAYYFNNILLEPKYQLMDHLAVIGVIGLPMTASTINFSNNPRRPQVMQLGNPSGNYGLKLSSEFGNFHQDGAMWGASLGYVSSPDNQFLNLDQTTSLQFAVGGGLEVKDNVAWMLEIYGQDNPSSFPVEALTYLSINGKSLSYRVGVGTGDLNNGGSNTFRAFGGISYSFGGDTKQASSSTVPTTHSMKAHHRQRYYYEDNSKAPSTPVQEDDLEKQEGPDVEEPEKALPAPESDNRPLKWSRMIASNSEDYSYLSESIFAENISPSHDDVSGKEVKSDNSKKPVPCPQSKAKAKKKIFKKHVTQLPPKGTVYTVEPAPTELTDIPKNQDLNSQNPPSLVEKPVVHSEVLKVQEKDLVPAPAVMVDPVTLQPNAAPVILVAAPTSPAIVVATPAPMASPAAVASPVVTPMSSPSPIPGVVALPPMEDKMIPSPSMSPALVGGPTSPVIDSCSMKVGDCNWDKIQDKLKDSKATIIFMPCCSQSLEKKLAEPVPLVVPSPSTSMSLKDSDVTDLSEKDKVQAQQMIKEIEASENKIKQDQLSNPQTLPPPPMEEESRVTSDDMPLSSSSSLEKEHQAFDAELQTQKSKLEEEKKQQRYEKLRREMKLRENQIRAEGPLSEEEEATPAPGIVSDKAVAPVNIPEKTNKKKPVKINFPTPEDQELDQLDDTSSNPPPKKTIKIFKENPDSLQEGGLDEAAPSYGFTEDSN